MQPRGRAARENRPGWKAALGDQQLEHWVVRQAGPDIEAGAHPPPARTTKLTPTDAHAPSFVDRERRLHQLRRYVRNTRHAMRLPWRAREGNRGRKGAWRGFHSVQVSPHGPL